MPILVNCPSCKAEFKVSEKFAGKQGPCPKCKTKITVPNLPAAEAEVKIHAPEGVETTGKAASGKGMAARSPTKPLTREEPKLRILPTVGFAVLAVAAVVGAWQGAETLAESFLVRAVGLLLVSPPIAVVAYGFLRNDELAPYRGLTLWLRGTVCGLIYAGLWLGYSFIPDDFRSEALYWAFMAPPFFVVGSGTAFGCFDLEIGNGFFHYCFYVLLTLGLGYVAGLQMPWQAMNF